MDSRKAEQNYATSLTTPPAALIFSSAFFETKRAFTMKGSLGSLREGVSFVKRTPLHRKGMNSLSVAQNLCESVVESVNHWDNLRVLLQLSLLRRGDKRPELVDVDDRRPVCVARKMVVAHTNLTEVTRMVLIEVGSSQSAA